jgi:hypothetical protein
VIDHVQQVALPCVIYELRGPRRNLRAGGPESFGPGSKSKKRRAGGLER